jgi:hypothetical protein
MKSSYNIKVAYLAVVSTVGLSSHPFTTAFAPYPSSVKRRQTDQRLGSPVETAMVSKKPTNLSSSFAEVEVEDVSKRVPVFVDLMPDELGHFPINHEHDIPELTSHHGAASLLEESPSQSQPSQDKEVWIARLLLLLSAALYGTNFTMVKSLDESLSVGISSTLRFGFAALCMLPWLLAPIDDELKAMTKDKMQKYKNDIVNNFEEPTTLAAGLAGMEIGVYNSIGYITQAVGLKTIPANKVRAENDCCSRLRY